ncbi:Uncharacterised protein [Mycobacteroides abscessus subsp. massiliense]|nr:Uncharacterised protein [Mycobacteroides abscessus subsp. massiliense]
MRQQTRLLQNPDRHRAHIVQGGVIATLVQPLFGFWPTLFWPVPQGEQCLFAAQFGAAAGYIQDLVGLHVHALALRTQLAGNRHKGAVMALVSAQMRHRNEHLARIRDRQTPRGTQAAAGLQTGITDPRGAGHQIGQVVPTGGERERGLVDVQRHPVTRTSQHPPQRGG